MRCPELDDLPRVNRDKTGWPWTEGSMRLPESMPNGKPWPRVSIITPHLNQGSFIEETIRSVLLQGYPDVEHIIVDGGSTDGSLDLIEQYSRWVKCIVIKDEEQSAALNRGFRLATGQLIGWQNSDDFYAPDCFRQAALASDQHSECAVFSGLVRGFRGYDSRPPWIFENCQDFSQQRLLNEVCVMNQSMFFRREVFDRGVFLREDLRFSMDIEFFWRLSFDGFLYCNVPSMIGYYRQHDNAKSTSYNVRADLESYAILRSLCRERRLNGNLRKIAREQLRGRFLRSFVNARRTILRKLCYELIMPL